MSCKYCNIDTVGTDICPDCQDIIEEHDENLRNGMCPVCKGSCENMDGTPCDECDGYGVVK